VELCFILFMLSGYCGPNAKSSEDVHTCSPSQRSHLGVCRDTSFDQCLPTCRVSVTFIVWLNDFDIAATDVDSIQDPKESSSSRFRSRDLAQWD
jgi:hypothetical protein